MVPWGESKWIKRNCTTIEEIALTTCDNLHEMSFHVSAFWMVLSKLVQKTSVDRPPKTNNHLRHGQINVQLNTTLVNMLDNI
jgi:hypothetical protein